jgi:CRISPR-associated exonuclease Cas4
MAGDPLMAALLLALATLALLARFLLRGMARNRALPEGEVVYNDTSRLSTDDTLVSDRYGLVGRPDYVVAPSGSPMPVEVKSRHCGERGPYPGEKGQLYAYCLLVEEMTGKAVSCGVIQFSDRQWTVPFGEAERREILALLGEMRALQGATDVRRSHSRAGRCRGCGFRAVCGEALV